MITKPKYTMPRDREMDMIPEVWNSISETNPLTEKWHGMRIQSFNTFFVRRKCMCVYDKKEWEKIGEYLVRRFITEPAYFNRIKKLHTFYGRRAENYAQKSMEAIRKADQKTLLNILVNLKNEWIAFDEVNVLPWFLGAEKLRESSTNLLREYNSNFTDKELDTLFAPNTLSLAAEEELQIFHVAIELKRGHKIENKIKHLVSEFGWMPFGYDGPTYWNDAFYQKKVAELAKSDSNNLRKKIALIKNNLANTIKEQKKIERKFKLTSQHKRLLGISRDLFVLTDERKKFQFQIHYAYHLVLKRLSSLCDLTEQELKYLETSEIAAMFKTRKFNTFKARAQKRIRQPMCVYTKDGAIKKVYTGKQALTRLWQRVEKENKMTEVSGSVANQAPSGKVTGKAKIILSSRNVSQMKKGEILITSMTTPDFVPAMRKAKAIITDEGGITSHAAIVSRELGIPCIIGTKFATKILQSGDDVELDTNNGIIKKL